MKEDTEKEGEGAAPPSSSRVQGFLELLQKVSNITSS